MQDLVFLLGSVVAAIEAIAATLILGTAVYAVVAVLSWLHHR